MPQRNSVSYNSIISAYARADDACAFLSALLSSGMRPTPYTFGALLAAPSLHLACGPLLHSLLLKSGLLHCNPFTGTALLGLYARNGRMGDAMKMFDEMPVRTLVTWNIIIYGFSHLGLVSDSMTLFKELLRRGIEPAECTFMSILSAFGSSDDLQPIEIVHVFVIKAAMCTHILVTNALLNAYSNCSSMHVAERLFVELPIKDVVTWNTMIGALAKSWKLERALELSVLMSLKGIIPTETTLATALGACAALNALEYGGLIHSKAIKHNLNTSLFVSLVGCVNINLGF